MKPSNKEWLNIGGRNMNNERVKLGDFGRALAKASREHRSVYWLKNQLDVFFKKLRSERNTYKGKFKTNGKKQNSRHTVLSNASNNS